METGYSLSVYENDSESVDHIDGEKSSQYVRIDTLFVNPEDRGQGKGRALLLDAIAEAKTYNLPIYIVAGMLGFDTDISRLVTFYESEGFTAIADLGGEVLMRY